MLTLALKEVGVRGAYTDEEIVNMLEALGLKVTPTETDGILSEPKVDGSLLFKKVAKFVDPANPEQLTPATFMMVGDDGEVALRQENDVLQSFEGKKLHNQI